MNKLGVVLGAAAIAAIAGCKDPDYVGRRSSRIQNEPKTIEAEPVPAAPVAEKELAPKANEPAPIVVAEVKGPAEVPAANAKGAAEVPAGEAKGVAGGEAAATAAAAEETTVYIVQRGDYLAKISKKFNIKVDSIKKLNDLKDDKIRIGQKLKLPGKVEVGEQTVPEGAIAKTAKKAYAPYTGATKEYVVKSGDTLGKIAYGNGINIRQLKELNGLAGDNLKIGQKLKIPAEGKVAEKAAAPVAAPVAAAPAPAPVAAAPAPAPVEATPAAPAQEAPAPAPAEAAAPAAPAVPTAAPAAGSTVNYTVQEGDDIIGIGAAFGLMPSQIKELNGLADGDVLKPGQVIKLPAEAQQ